MNSEIAPVASVFITGLNTAVGRALALKLRAAGHSVAGTVESSEQAAVLRAYGITPAYPDLTRAGELRSAIQGVGATLVVNCASQAANHAPQAAANWSLPLARQAEALAQAAAEAGAAYLLHTSFTLAGGHVTDDTEAAEPLLQEMQAAEAIALAGSVPATVVRLGVVYGATDPALEGLRDSLRVGRMFDSGEETVPAHWIYLPDAVNALAAALDRRPAGVVLEIVDEQPMPPAEFARTFARLQSMGAPGRAPAFLKRAPAAQRQLWQVETHPASAAAREALGWSPRYATAEAGLEDMLLLWRAAMGAQA